MTNPEKAFLIILDGWGHGKNPEVSAIAKAKTPYVDSLYRDYPNTELVTYGDEVGLPEGQMGNSEVGHLNLGAGRVVFQELARINNSIRNEELKLQPKIKEVISQAKENNKAVHLMGLVSDGGVHSHINHVKALCDIFSSENIPVFIHAFMDGRDTGPESGIEYMKDLQDHIKDSSSRLSSIIGRYFAMDRDNRWERIQKAYDLLIHGKGTPADDPCEAIEDQYREGTTDEFLEPIKLLTLGEGVIKPEDIVLFFNFRTDRPRQLTEVLTQTEKNDYGMSPLPLSFYTMTEYNKDFKDINVIFSKDNIANTIGEVLAKNNLKQLRIAETEKYPHVTFFFNGGRDQPFENEERILINSPKVATYDLKPQMSAYEVKNAIVKNMNEETPDFICLNFANADMVGHTGIMDAAVIAVETVDQCLSEIIPLALKHNYHIFAIADHGNADIMRNEDGNPHTAHTTNPVPCIYIHAKNKDAKLKPGKLADIAPSILSVMEVEIPSEMTGDNILC